jgi:hypothetical protein
MQPVIDDFNQRVTEVDRYLQVLERLENPSVVLYDRNTQRKLRVYGEGSLKVMKATVFLLIYNVVESSVRSAFGYLYDQIEAEAKSCSELSEELRQVWIRQQFLMMDEGSASPKNYRELVERIASDILTESTVQLSKDRLPVAGNLNSAQIRRVCQTHGVSAKAHHRASGGVELETVKSQRNALAHGDTSFSTCGEQYTVSDLKRIKQQAVVFVRSILRNVRRFVQDKRYAAVV